MSRLRLASAVLCVLLAVPARAQEQVEVFAAIFGVRTSLVNVDATLRGFGGILASTPLTHVPTGFLNNASTVAGGRYLAWITDSVNHAGQDLFLFDRRTRTVSTATDALPAPPPGTFLSSFYIVGTDTHRPRLFVQEYRTSQGGPSLHLWTIDLRGGAPVVLATTTTGAPSFAYAGETDEAFINEWSSGLATMQVVNATTGAEVRRFTHSLGFLGTLTEPGGRIVWVDDGLGMRALDTRTGAVLATSPLFRAAQSTFDAARGILLVRQSDFLVAVDPLRLTELGRARVSFSPPSNMLWQGTQTLPGRWMTGAYLLRSSYRTGNSTCNEISLEALDAAGAKRATADLLAQLGPGGTGCTAVGFLFRSPFAPSALTSSVSGGTVRLSWKDPGDTTEFELEFGFAPGQRAGAIRVGTTTSLTLPGVPPGTYYVRVRALNEVGPSPASSDIRVVIP